MVSLLVLLCALGVALPKPRNAPLRVEPEYVSQMRHSAWDLLSPVATNRVAVVLDSVDAAQWHERCLIECEEELMTRSGAAAPIGAADRVVLEPRELRHEHQAARRPAAVHAPLLFPEVGHLHPSLDHEPALVARIR